MSSSTKLLIAYDGSAQAETALGDLLRAGLPDAVEAVVLTVADVVAPAADSEPAAGTSASPSTQRAWSLIDRQLAEAKGLAQEGVRRLEAQFPTWQVRAESVAGSPGWTLVTYAKEWQSDLIVVGPHGKSMWDRLILGSVSLTAVTHAHCSVRVARQHKVAPDRPLRILLGVDGSASAAAAVQAVVDRAWPAGSEIRLVTAMDSMLVSTMANAPLPAEPQAAGDGQDETTRIHNLVDAAAAGLRSRHPGVTISTRIKQEDAKRLLVAEADEWDADAIFVGAQGLGAWQRFWLGSVSAAVAARAHCTVEVVRSPAHQDNSL